MICAEFMNVALIGMMGSGKTAVGRKLALKLGWKFADSDQRIEVETNMTIAEIFARFGEPHFRSLEKDMIRRICREEKLVIATGGGAPLDEENWRNLKNRAQIFWLDAGVETLCRRLQDSALARPLIQTGDLRAKLKDLLAARAHLYARADHRIETDELTEDEVANRILEQLQLKADENPAR